MSDTTTAEQAAVEYLRATLDRDMTGAAAAFTLFDSMAYEGELSESEAAKVTIALARIGLRLACLLADAHGLDPHRVLDLIAEYSK